MEWLHVAVELAPGGGCEECVDCEWEEGQDVVVLPAACKEGA